MALKGDARIHYDALEADQFPTAAPMPPPITATDEYFADRAASLISIIALQHKPPFPNSLALTCYCFLKVYR